MNIPSPQSKWSIYRSGNGDVDHGLRSMCAPGTGTTLSTEVSFFVEDIFMTQMLKLRGSSRTNYEEHLDRYHQDLKVREQLCDILAKHQLSTLERALDQCMKLRSPYREAAFVGYVCRIARCRKHLAA